MKLILFMDLVVLWLFFFVELIACWFFSSWNLFHVGFSLCETCYVPFLFTSWNCIFFLETCCVSEFLLFVKLAAFVFSFIGTCCVHGNFLRGTYCLLFFIRETYCMRWFFSHYVKFVHLSFSPRKTNFLLGIHFSDFSGSKLNLMRADFCSWNLLHVDFSLWETLILFM